MKVQSPLVNLTGGEVSARLNGRPDVTKQRNGLRVCENFQIVVHGGARKRSGTQFVAALPNNDDVVMRSFQYSTQDSYQLIFGEGYIWIAKDRGLVTNGANAITGISKASTAVVTATGHNLQNGDRVILTGVGGMVEVNNRTFIVANRTADTFQLQGLNSTGFTTYTSGGSAAGIIAVSTTYLESELQELRFAQFNDVIYITHKDHPLRKLSRVSNTSWTLEDVQITTGPFRTINGDAEKTMTVEVRTMTVTGITNANPAVVTVSGAMIFEVDEVISFSGVAGTLGTSVNGNAYDITAINGQQITISLNASALAAYTSGGVMATATTLWGTLPVGARVLLETTWSEFTAESEGALYRLNEGGNGTGVQGPPFESTDNDTLYNGLSYTSEGNVYGINNYQGDRNNWKYFNRVPAHESGSVRVIGTRQGGNEAFDANFLHPGYCVVQITSYISATQASARIVRYQMPQSILEAGTSQWEEGAWSTRRGFPRCCAFFEQRLWLGGTAGEPSAIWGSKSSAFENFQDGTEDKDAIVYRAASGYADTIRWLSGGRVLVAGTSQGEYAVAASNQNEALTPDNLRMLLQTTYGTSDCPPVRVNEAVLYPQRNGKVDNPSRKLREFSYDFTADTFNSVDLTVFAEHITGTGITRIDYAMQPDPMIVCRREDGQIAVCTYERLQEVIAWWRIVLGGTDAVAKAVSVCPGASGDDVWLAVSRTIDGETVTYLEVIHPGFEPVLHDKEDAVFTDAALTYSGAETSTISGLYHLRGETVKVLNNGAVESGVVSADGVLTLLRPTTLAHIGLSYTAILETQDIEAGARAGTAQSTMKRISELFIRVIASLGGGVGSPKHAGDLDPLKYWDNDTLVGSESPPLYDGLIRIPAPGEHDREARIRIEHDDPLPFFVTAFVSDVNAQG